MGRTDEEEEILPDGQGRALGDVSDGPGQEAVDHGAGGGKDEGVARGLLLLEVEPGQHEGDAGHDDGLEHT